MSGGKALSIADTNRSPKIETCRTKYENHTDIFLHNIVTGEDTGRLYIDLMFIALR